MKLSHKAIEQISGDNLALPSPAIFDRPEKVLQFGTGVLLRGLPDYFIDKANREGVFNGRVVVVKSTASGDTRAFDQQNQLYTICVRGLENGEVVNENIVCSAISRVLTASLQWDDVLQCAHQPELQVVISNTTEVGLQLVKEDIFQKPPASFPAKLLAFLHERYIYFKGDETAGMVIIPTELLADNGNKLASIAAELARYNRLDKDFIQWLQTANRFCSSLVDRIVPGKPASLKDAGLQYEDDLAIICEVYRLWAIEGDETIKRKLSFEQCDPGVVISPDIAIFRELKIRLLNGAHTLCSGLAWLAGFSTVVEAMNDPVFYEYAEELMLEEIAPSIPVALPHGAAFDFGKQVLERFRNPYIHHPWLNITLQYSSKLKIRVLPVLMEYYGRFQKTPSHIALGFAAHFLFMRTVKSESGSFEGNWNGRPYTVNDDRAAWYAEAWLNREPADLAHAALSDSDFWGHDLSQLPRFESEVIVMMGRLRSENILDVVSDLS